jgi:hypothetical protein
MTIIPTSAGSDVVELRDRFSCVVEVAIRRAESSKTEMIATHRMLDGHDVNLIIKLLSPRRFVTASFGYVADEVTCHLIVAPHFCNTGIIPIEVSCIYIGDIETVVVPICPAGVA